MMYSLGIPVIDDCDTIIGMAEAKQLCMDTEGFFLTKFYCYHKVNSYCNARYADYHKIRYGYTQNMVNSWFDAWILDGMEELDCWRVLTWGPEFFSGWASRTVSDVRTYGFFEIKDYRSASTNLDAVEAFSRYRQRRVNVTTQALLHLRKARGRRVDTYMPSGPYSHIPLEEVILMPGCYDLTRWSETRFGGIKTTVLELVRDQAISMTAQGLDESSTQA